MRTGGFLRLSCIIFGVCFGSLASATEVSVCSLKNNPAMYLNSEVKVTALVFAGEYPRIEFEKCSFLYATGDDYQVFGDRFKIKDDKQWKLFNMLLATRECASNVRVAKAKLIGTVIRVPATGTIPAEEMPFELVIRSVSKVKRVPVNCTPPTVSVPQSAAAGADMVFNVCVFGHRAVQFTSGAQTPNGRCLRQPRFITSRSVIF